MEKVARGPQTQLQKNWLGLAKDLGSDLEGLRLLYSEAKTAKASQEILDKIKELATSGSAGDANIDSVND